MLVALAMSTSGVAAATPHWTLVNAPNVGGADVVDGMSCPIATFCMASGDSGAELWNGSSWSVVPTPPTNSALVGISCTSQTFCMSVGSVSSGTGWQTLTERWNGKEWTILPSQDPGVKVNRLAGVSCVSTAFCMAVGWYNDASDRHTLIEEWNGSAWALVGSPNIRTKDALHGVSCVSTAFCAAVGDYHRGGGYDTLTELWNGKTWSLVSSPNTSGSNNSQLEATSCTSSSFCAAVGFYNIAGDHTLTELWNGATWTISNSPSPMSSDTLVGVSCTGATSMCMTVGSYTPPSPGYGSQTLIESWNGTAWSVAKSPNSSATEDFLNAISCANGAFCMAGGQSFPASAGETLIEKYSG